MLRRTALPRLLILKKFMALSLKLLREQMFLLVFQDLEL